MIQRIQTIYIIIAAIVISLIYFFPVAEFIDQQNHIYELRHSGIVSIHDGIKENIIKTYSITILTSIIALISIITIFLYKRRVLQMRLCIYNILLCIGLEIFFWFYRQQILKILQYNFVFKFPIILPVINIILFYLAFRAIKKDEELIRSSERLR
jgi:hypothetical protein